VTVSLTWGLSDAGPGILTTALCSVLIAICADLCREDGLICQWQPSAAYRQSTLGGGDRGGSGSLTYAQHLDSIDEHQATKMYKVRFEISSVRRINAHRGL